MSKGYAISKPDICDMTRFGGTMVTPVVRFGIDFAANSWVEPGKIELLEAIRGHGSLSQAARRGGVTITTFGEATALVFWLEPISVTTAPHCSSAKSSAKSGDFRGQACFIYQ
jgi:hypothetical protein